MRAINNQKKLILLGLIFFIIFILAACSTESSDDKSSYQVSGMLKDAIEKDGVEDIKIKLINKDTEILTSNEQGKWSANNLYGPTEIIPVAKDYDFEPTSVAVSEETEDIIFFVKERLDYDELVFVEGDKFELGSNDGFGNETPKTEVKVSDFYIRKYPITQYEYKKITGENPAYHTTGNHPEISWANRRPVEKVTWWDAINFANKLSEKNNLVVAYDENNGKLLDSNGNHTTDISQVEGFRLPTEAEWEFAARGGVARRDTIYSGGDDIADLAWYLNNSKQANSARSDGRGTMPVGMKASNELGLFDMSGNVWEWVQDYYDTNAYQNLTEKNPYNKEESNSKVYRGGSWYHFAYRSRVSFRGRYNPDYKSNTIGFRLVRSKN